MSSPVLKVLCGLAVLGWLGACGDTAAYVGDSTEPQGQAKGKEAWSTRDSPFLFNQTLETKFASLPTQGEAATIPWAGSYWPTYHDNINFKWAGDNSKSASKKYELAFFGADAGVSVEDYVSRYHGIDSLTSRKECETASECDSRLGEVCAIRPGKTKGRCAETWWGICHAWTPAAILLPEPKKAVVKNGVRFEVQDLKALASLVHNDTTTKFVSLRCYQETSLPDGGGIQFDRYGRPTDTNVSCRDTNAGTYHILLANYLGVMRQSFAEDRTFNYEVWNQPLRSYRILSQRDVTAEEANRLVGVTANEAIDGGAPLSAYRFNTRAVRFVDVSMEVKFISESSPSDGYTAPSINWYTGVDRYEYVLELDTDGKIIGGEWVGSSKREHPDFLWLPIAPGSSVAGGLIKTAEVKALVMESAGVAPNTGGGRNAEVTESAQLATGAWKHFGPYDTLSGTITVDMTGSGDGDLYVRMGSQPTATTYDCRPYTGGSAESCIVEGPGPLSVSVYGYSASNVTLTIRYVAPGLSDGGVIPTVRDAGSMNPGGAVDAGSVNSGGAADAGSWVPGTGSDAGSSTGGGSVDAGTALPITITGTVGLRQWYRLTQPVTQGQKVVLRTTAPNDVDLYLKMNADPSTSSYNARAISTSGNETVSFTPTANGVLSIGVYGYAASTFTLSISNN